MSVEATAWVLRHKVGDTVAKVVLWGIADHADRYGTNSYPSQETLAEYAEVTRRTVVSKIHWLAENGWIEVERRSSREGRKSNMYSILGMQQSEGISQPLSAKTPQQSEEAASQEPSLEPPSEVEPPREDEPAHISRSAERMADAYEVRPLVAHYFDTAKKLGVVVPQTNAPLLVHRIQDCLDAGATERQVKGGIELMVAKGMAPQSLAYFVTEFSSQHRAAPTTRTEDHWWEHVDEETILSPEENAARARLIAQGRYEQAAASDAASTADSPSSPSPEPASATETFSPATPTTPPSGESDEPAHPTIPSGQTDTGD